MKNAKHVEVAYAESSNLVRKGVMNLINGSGKAKVTIEATDGQDLLKKLQKEKRLPDIIVMEISMDGMDGHDTIDALRSDKQLAAIPVLILTNLHHSFNVTRMLHNGVLGYIDKNSKPEELMRAINAVAQGKYYKGGCFTKELLEVFNNNELPKVKITPKQKNFLKFCCEGLTYHEMGERLGLSMRSVENYRERLFDNLGMNNKADLVMLGVRIGAVVVD